MNKSEHLADLDNVNEVIAYLIFNWKRAILEAMGLDLDGCYSESDNPEDHTVEEKIALRKVLSVNNIYIDEGEGVRIYLDKDLIGEFKKPRFELRLDLSQVDPKKKKYVVIFVEEGSVFDDYE